MIVPVLSDAAILEAQLWQLVAAAARPGAAMLVAPLFGARAVPVQVRLILSLAVGIAALGATPVTMPAGGLVTGAGILLLAGEVVAGAALGLAVQIGHVAALVAGEVIGSLMGIGFAGMVDPASGQGSPVIGAWLSTLGLFLFVAADGHLMLIAAIVQSYAAWPPGLIGVDDGVDAARALVGFGGHLFSAGLAIALPVAATLLAGQIALALLARTAPQLNLFAVGFPAAIIGGLVLMALTMPLIATGIAISLGRGLDTAIRLAGGG